MVSYVWDLIPLMYTSAQKLNGGPFSKTMFMAETLVLFAHVTLNCIMEILSWNIQGVKKPEALAELVMN